MRVLIVFLALGLACSVAQADEVYRTVQPDGTVVFSDRPLSSASVRVSVSSRPADPVAVDPEPTAAERSTVARRASPPAEALAAAREEQRALRAEACQKARQASEMYEMNPRLYETLPGGGRRYLTDEEIVQARLSARQAVADLCDD
jgi:hypothetical protein